MEQRETLGSTELSYARNSYATPMSGRCHPARLPMRSQPHMQPSEESAMLDLFFLGGGVLLLCLLIAYARLTHRL